MYTYTTLYQGKLNFVLGNRSRRTHFTDILQVKNFKELTNKTEHKVLLTHPFKVVCFGNTKHKNCTEQIKRNISIFLFNLRKCFSSKNLCLLSK